MTCHVHKSRPCEELKGMKQRVYNKITLAEMGTKVLQPIQKSGNDVGPLHMVLRFGKNLILYGETICWYFENI